MTKLTLEALEGMIERAVAKALLAAQKPVRATCQNCRQPPMPNRVRCAYHLARHRWWEKQKAHGKDAAGPRPRPQDYDRRAGKMAIETAVDGGPLHELRPSLERVLADAGGNKTKALWNYYVEADKGREKV